MYACYLPCVDIVNINSSSNGGLTSFTGHTWAMDPKEQGHGTRQNVNSATWNKENEVLDQNTEWLSRNDNYQRQSISMPFQGQETITSGMNAMLQLDL